MTKPAYITILVLAVAFGGVLAWGLMTMSELNLTKDELSSTKVQLASVQNELADTQDELADTTKELADTEKELSSTKIELSDMKDELASTEIELASTSSELMSTRTELTNTQSELDSMNYELESTEQQLTVAQETLAGLGITISASTDCDDAELVDSPEATNPTWAQLRVFLTEDRTDQNNYIRNVYDCSQFSRDVHNNSEAAGIRAGVVHVSWRSGNNSHALNAFLTTDYGLVYVDCTGGPDTVARVKVAKTYRSVSLPFVSITNIRDDYWWDRLFAYYYIRSSTGGQAVTDSIIIYW